MEKISFVCMTDVSKRDIESRKDLEVFIQSFYQKLLSDDQISFFFREVVPLDLNEHLPRLVDFWESLVFQQGSFRGNVMGLHLAMDRIYAIEKTHFNIWLSYFQETAQDLFAGPRSDRMQEQAESIALLMQVKIRQSRDHLEKSTWTDHKKTR